MNNQNTIKPGMTKEVNLHPTEYDGYYVTETGDIFNSELNRFLKQSKTAYGYLCVGLFLNGKWKTFQSHRLIAKVFVDNPENKPFVNHIDGNKQNNHYKNLEWCTNKENLNHAWKLGLHTPEKCLNDYMLNKRIKIINNSNGVIYDSISQAARETGIKRHTIQSIVDGRIINTTTLDRYTPLNKCHE